MTSAMTGRERLQAVINGCMPDRPPWAPLIDGFYTQCLPAQGYPAMQPFEVLEHLGCDYFPRHVWIAKSSVHNCQFTEQYSGKECLRSWNTPVGNVFARFRDTGNTQFCYEHWIKTIEDVKIIQYICENTEYREDYANWHAWDKRVGDNGITPSVLMCTGLYKFIEDCGLETFTYLLADYPEVFAEAMHAHHQANMRLAAVAAASPAQVFIVHENSSTQYMSPRWYAKYSPAHFDEVANYMHASGKKVLAHMCGHLKRLLPLLAQQTLDGYESVCPPTSGNTWAHEALQSLPGKIVMGGLEPAALERMSVEQTTKYTCEVLGHCAPYRGRFILGTGDATACGTPLANLIEVGKVVKNWTY